MAESRFSDNAIALKFVLCLQHTYTPVWGLSFPAGCNLALPFAVDVRSSQVHVRSTSFVWSLERLQGIGPCKSCRDPHERLFFCPCKTMFADQCGSGSFFSCTNCFYPQTDLSVSRSIFRHPKPCNKLIHWGIRRWSSCHNLHLIN